MRRWIGITLPPSNMLSRFQGYLSSKLIAERRSFYDQASSYSRSIPLEPVIHGDSLMISHGEGRMSSISPVSTHSLYLRQTTLILNKARWALPIPTIGYCKAALTDHLIDDLGHRIGDVGIKLATTMAT